MMFFGIRRTQLHSVSKTGSLFFLLLIEDDGDSRLNVPIVSVIWYKGLVTWEMEEAVDGEG